METFKVYDKDWDFLADEDARLEMSGDGVPEAKVDETIRKTIDDPQATSLFREYDLRGHISLFTEEATRAIVQAMTVMMYGLSKPQNKRIIVGSDNEDYNIRSKELAKDICVRAGLVVYDAGIMTSPGIFLAQQHFDCSAIAAFTASHNPYGDKGMKAGVIPYTTFGPAGVKRLMEQFMKGQYIEKEGGKAIEIDHEELFDAYSAMIREKNVRISKSPTILINTLNATGWPTAQHVLSSFGVQLIGINTEMTGSTEGEAQRNPELEDVKVQTRESLTETARKLKEEGKETKRIFALAFDRDADRMVPVGQERTCSADELAIIAFRQKMKNLARLGKKEAMVVCDMKTSMAVFTDRELREQGVTVVPWYTGNSYIKQFMRHLIEEGKDVIAGAEKSGHLFQEGCYDEPLESALLILQYLEENDMSLEEALDTITPYELGPSTKIYLDTEAFSPKNDRHTLKDRKYEIMDTIVEMSKQMKGATIMGRYEIEEVVTLGQTVRAFVRSDKGRGNIVLRPSSNEEVMTLNIEAQRHDDSEQMVKDMENAVIFDILASTFEEFRTIKEGNKKGAMNKKSTLEDQQAYLEGSPDWKKKDDTTYVHTSGRMVYL